MDLEINLHFNVEIIQQLQRQNKHNTAANNRYT